MAIEKTPAELCADMLDVHVLDMLVHIEALLRSAREVQRGILRVRGVPATVTDMECTQAATEVRRRLDRMLTECESARDAVEEARQAAEGLTGLRQ